MIPFFIKNSVHFDSISLQLLISKCTNHLGFIMNGKRIHKSVYESLHSVHKQSATIQNLTFLKT